MKTVFIVRHAKANWMEEGGEDRLRTLNAEGIVDATKMGKLLAEDNLIPDLILSSTALRAEETAKLLAKGINFDESDIEYKNALYNASAETIVLVLQSIETQANKVMIVAHNPGVSNFLSLVTDGASMNMGTCDIGIVELDIEEWKQCCLPGKGFLSRFIEIY